MTHIKQRLDELSDRAINGQKIWRARKLMRMVRMVDWKAFRLFVFEGIRKCEEAGYNPMEHFVETNAIMVENGCDDDYWLSAYGCNLVCDCIPDFKFKGEFLRYFACEVFNSDMEDEMNKMVKYKDRVFAKTRYDAATLRLTGLLVGRRVHEKIADADLAHAAYHYFGNNSDYELKKEYGISPKESYMDYAPVKVLNSLSTAREKAYDTIKTDWTIDEYGHPFGNPNFQPRDYVETEHFLAREAMGYPYPEMIPPEKESIKGPQKYFIETEMRYRDSVRKNHIGEEVAPVVPFTLPEDWGKK